MQNDILISILLKLLNRKIVTAQSLSEEYELSKRTIYRYIDVLSAGGIPIVSKSGTGGGIYIDENFKLDKMYFTDTEKSRIISALKSLSGTFSDDITDNIIDKLVALGTNSGNDSLLLRSEHLVIDGGPWGESATFKAKLDTLKEAVFSDFTIEIRYNDNFGAVTARRIEPHTIVLKDGIWYLYAYCHLRKGFRLFKIVRINSIFLTDVKFNRQPVDIKALPWNVSFSESSVEKVELIINFSEKSVSDIEEWLGSNAIFFDDDGQCFAKATVTGGKQLVRKLLGFGSDILVISPESIILQMQKECEMLLDTYIGSEEE